MLIEEYSGVESNFDRWADKGLSSQASDWNGRDVKYGGNLRAQNFSSHFSKA